MDTAELAQAESDEPVARHRRWLTDERGIAEDVLQRIEAGVEAEVAKAFGAAKASDPPPAEELYTDVFSEAGASPR
jgi:TPP-dependent pyruvate/acetoin dehydrogenase alpha subunit